jgi:hypothetical protein
MNDLPQAQFNQLLSTYGSQLCEEQQRCEALLRDTFPEYPRQVSLLVNALKQGVPQELLASHNKIPFEVTRSRLALKLADEMFVQDEAAQWVVNSWSEALGVAAPRPGTVMQPPEVSGGTGNTPPGAFAPTMVRPSDSGNSGNAGNMGNSGNYNNPANYNPPATPPYGAPVNYGAGNVMVRPTSGQPQVWVWFIVYCVAMGLLYLVNALLNIIAITAADTSGGAILRVILVMIYSIGTVLFAAAPFLPKTRWAWIYDIVVICIGCISCCLPASIALLIFWLKPELKTFFNVPNS